MAFTGLNLLLTTSLHFFAHLGNLGPASSPCSWLCFASRSCILPINSPKDEARNHSDCPGKSQNSVRPHSNEQQRPPNQGGHSIDSGRLPQARQDDVDYFGLR